MLHQLRAFVPVPPASNAATHFTGLRTCLCASTEIAPSWAVLWKGLILRLGYETKPSRLRAGREDEKMSKQQSYTVKNLSAWDMLALENALERLISQGRVEEHSAQALLKKLRQASVRPKRPSSGGEKRMV